MIRITNKNGVVLNTKDKYCTENIEIAVDDTNLKPECIVKDQVILGVTGTAQAGGIIPSGRIDITENTGSGFLDISEYALAKVNVPIPEGYIIPTGELNISKNGDYDITEYAKVKVGVSPMGQIKITENGIHNVGQYLTANVQVEGAGGITPEGTIELTSNGDHDVTNYATAKVNVPNVIPEGYIVPSGEKAITTNGKHDITSFASVDVNVPIPDGYIIPSGNFAITENGDYNIRDKETVSVNVAGGGGGDETALFKEFISTRPKSYYDYLFYRSKATNLDKYFALIDWKGVTGADYLCAYNTSLVDFPVFNDLSTLQNLSYAFCSCKFSGDLELTMPALTTAKNMFGNCINLTNIQINAPKLGHLESIISDCSKLQTAKLYTGTAWGTSYINYSYMCSSCSKLETLDLHRFYCISTSYCTNMFYMAHRLKTWIIRTMDTIPTIPTNLFSHSYHMTGTVNSTYNPDGLQDGSIHVPADKVEELKKATNWSTYADIIKPIYAVDYVGNGHINSQIENEETIITATPDEGNTFKGWYLGTVGKVFIPTEGDITPLEVSPIEGYTYGFVLDEETGYYVSNNQKMSRTSAIGRVSFTSTENQVVVVECICNAEAGCDYGMIGKMGVTLSTTYNASETNCIFTKMNPTTAKQYTLMTVPLAPGDYFFDIKFRKDTSADNGDDSMKVKVWLQNGTVTRSSSSNELYSADATINVGVVDEMTMDPLNLVAIFEEE